MTLWRERRVILAVKDDIHRSKVAFQQLIFGGGELNFHQIYCEGKGGHICNYGHKAEKF